MIRVVDNNALATQSNKIKKPLNDLLKNWQIILAKEIVEQWQESSSSMLEENLLNSINLINNQSSQNFTISEKKLELKIRKIKESIKYSEFNLNNNQELFKNLEEISQELHVSLLVLRSENIEAMKELVSFDWQEIVAHNLVSYFDTILANLAIQKADLLHQKNTYQRNEISAWQAYFILNQKLHKVTINSSTYNYLTESKWRAIFVCFEAKLKVVYYHDFIQRIENLIDQSQTYYQLLIKSSQILDHLQQSLNKKSALSLESLQAMSLPVFMYLKQVDAEQQKKKIENWIGHSLNHWGDSTKSWQEIENKLLENLEPTVLNVYQDFHQFFNN
jgi:hypothetical protein